MERPPAKRPRSTMLHVQRARQDEPGAWDRLYAKVLEEANAHCRATPPPASFDVDDVAQLAIHSVFTSLKSFVAVNPDSFRAWVRTILNNRTTDLWRRARSQKRGGGVDTTPLEGLDEDMPLSVEDPSAYSPLEFLQAREVQERLDYVEAGLSDKDRAILELRERQALPFADIAKREGLGSDATARSRYHDARQRRIERMKEFLAED